VVTKGAAQSCGCLQKEVATRLGIQSLKKALQKNPIHGQSGRHMGGKRVGRKTPTYASWESMRSRCNNPNAVGYENWGGRGICVCERWDSFVNFLADMGPRPMGHEIDRIFYWQRQAWCRAVGRRQTCVVHGDPNNPGNVRMTPNRVALIDWDESSTVTEAP
jgi:hypothetical protein